MEGLSDTAEQSISANPITAIVQENIRRTYEKVRDENLGDLLNTQQTEEGSDCDEFDGPRATKLEDLQTLIVSLESEVDKLINKQSTLDKLVDQCHYILGDPDRKYNLAGLVKDLQIEGKGYERELDKEKQKSEKMLMELYDYCKSINKLENQRNQQRHEMKAIEEEIKKVRRENIMLSENCKALQAANMQHVEKEKTLENLKKRVADLESSHGNLLDENSNYRIGYGNSSTRTYRRQGLRAQNRRGSVLETSVNNINNKKTVSKPALGVSNTRRKPLGRF